MKKSNTPEVQVSFDRRQFIKLVGSACAVSALEGCTYAEVFTKLGESFSFDLSDSTFSPLKEVGGAVDIDGAGRKMILIRISETEVTAINRICTHTDCDMAFDQFGQWDGEKLTCICHGSQFSPQGEVLKGPADRPLDTYDVTIDGDQGSILFSESLDMPEAGAEGGAGTEGGMTAGDPGDGGDEGGAGGGGELDPSEVPEPYRDLVNDLSDDPSAIESGMTLYNDTFCGSCHGAEGEGGIGLPFAIDQSDKSDGFMYWKIAEGVEGTSMNPYQEQLSEEQIWQIVSYLRTLATP